MIVLYILLYVLMGLCVAYGYLIIEYIKYYKGFYSFSKSLEFLDDKIALAIPIGVFFPIAIIIGVIMLICRLIGSLIVKLIDKIVNKEEQNEQLRE